MFDGIIDNLELAIAAAFVLVLILVTAFAMVKDSQCEDLRRYVERLKKERKWIQRQWDETSQELAWFRKRDLQRRKKDAKIASSQ